MLAIVKNLLESRRSSLGLQRKEHHIHYELIDFKKEKSTCRFKCAHAASVFETSLKEAAHDTGILYQLHPAHSCFIGIEYARFIKFSGIELSNIVRAEPMHRYGQYKLKFYDKSNNIIFCDLKTQKEHCMDPRDLVLSSEIIQEFDSSESFFIGLEAGIKMGNCINQDHSNSLYSVRARSDNKSHPYLRVVK